MYAQKPKTPLAVTKGDISSIDLKKNVVTVPLTPGGSPVIEFSCPKCGKVLKAPDGPSGRVAACTGCRTRVAIPSAATDAASSAPTTAPPTHQPVPIPVGPGRSRRGPTSEPAPPPNPPPVLIPVGPVPRVRRTTSLHRTFYCPDCGSHRQPYPGEIHPRCHTRGCNNDLLSELDFVLWKARHELSFIKSGLFLLYRPEGEERAARFIQFCVEIAGRGIPAAVVVASELAKVGEPEDSSSGTPRMRAFLATEPYYELLYEREMLYRTGDPWQELRLDVIEAVLDHPLYRESSSRCGRGVFDRPPMNPAPLLQAANYDYVPNPFEEAEENDRRQRRQERTQFRNDTLTQFVLLPLVLLGAFVGVYISFEIIPDNLPEVQAVVGVVSFVIGGIALFRMWSWFIPN